MRPPTSRSRRVLLSLAFLALLLVPAPAARGQEGEAPRETFGGVSDVTVIEVPVQVAHDGRPVRGLTADDFRVLDEGEPRAITSFEVVDLGAPAAAVPGAPAAPAAIPMGGRRHFLLLFDLAFSEPNDLSRAEEAARDLVDRGLEPSDLVAVAFYSPRRGASLVLNFTTDRTEVRRVLDGLRFLLDGRGDFRLAEDPDGPERRDPLGLVAGPFDAMLADLGQAAGIEMSLAEEAIKNHWAGPSGGLSGGLEYNKLSNMMWSAEQQIADRRAGKVADLSRAIASLARQTAGIRGAKHLVWLSRGFDAELLTPDIEPGPRVADHGWWAPGGGSWILEEVDRMIEELERAGWVVHAVELDREMARLRFKEGLFYVAEGTGGALYDNENDLSRAMSRVLEATSVSYVLTFEVAALPPEPDFRRLTVEVRGAPRGAQVSHRAGYYVPRPFGALSPAERRSEALELIVSGDDRDGIGLEAAALPGTAPGGGWTVPVLLRLGADGLLAGDAGRQVGAEIFAYAFRADGGVADFFSYRIVYVDEAARAKLAETGLAFRGDLALSVPGSYRVRLLARSLRNGAVSLHTLPVEVPGPSS
jgi:VWFA-related protein